MESGLYIVATPIGHLDDITLRALRILKDVELLAAEDTRHTRKLLQYHGIERSVTTYHEHSSTDAMIENVIYGALKMKEKAILAPLQARVVEATFFF